MHETLEKLKALQSKGEETNGNGDVERGPRTPPYIGRIPVRGEHEAFKLTPRGATEPLPAAHEMPIAKTSEASTLRLERAETVVEDKVKHDQPLREQYAIARRGLAYPEFSAAEGQSDQPSWKGMDVDAVDVGATVKNC